MKRHRGIEATVARRREVAARNQIDPRTLERALRDGPEAVRAGLTRDRVISALAELGCAAPGTLDNPPPRAA